MQENIKLAPFTTFRIGGNAIYFTRVKNIDELKSAVFFAQSKELPVFILGGGSNILFSDYGFNGLVIKIEIDGLEIEEEGLHVVAKVGAGVNWDYFVNEMVSKSLSGVENLSLIPGSVGASAVQNIGAYGEEAKNSISFVEVFNSKTMKLEKLSSSECGFSYRDSIFKNNEGRNLIVLNVNYILSKDFNPNLTYPELGLEMSNHNLPITVSNIRKSVINIRKNKLPSIEEYGTAGSYFKNPIVDTESFHELITQYPNTPHWMQGDDKVKVSAGFLIDKVANMKGESVNDAFVWEKQALVIVNKGKATSSDVVDLKNKIRNKVFQLTKINLENEVIEIK